MKLVLFHRADRKSLSAFQINLRHPETATGSQAAVLRVVLDYTGPRTRTVDLSTTHKQKHLPRLDWH